MNTAIERDWLSGTATRRSQDRQLAWTGFFAAVLAAVVLLSGRATAQSAPEGNAHPKSELVSASGEVTDPFGPPVFEGGPATVLEKTEFAKAVDLSALRDLAVFHNGRVKVLDTLARETVNKITGRRRYEDFIHGGEAKPGQAKDSGGAAVRAYGYEPIFTLLDLIIDPSYYADKPLIAINYLPARRAILEAAFPGDEGTVERWMKLTRVTPKMVNQYGEGVFIKHESETAYREAQNKILEAANLWMMSRSNMVLVAPARRDLPWSHLSALPDDSAAKKAGLALGAAWRARDASGVNAAAAALAAELPRINAEVYPTTRRTLEITYNRANAFEWGYWAYLGSLVTLLLAFGTGRTGLARIGAVLLVAAVLLHAFGFVTRCLIAERFAIQNQFESMTGLSLFAAVVGLVIMLAKRQWLFGAATAAVGFMVLLTATQARIPGVHIEREAAILNTSVLLKYHVTTVLVSYGLIALGFVVSLFYLGVHYFGPGRAASVPAGAGSLAAGGGGMVSVALGQDGVDEATPTGRARTLKDLDTAQMTVLQLAFWTLGVGILLGAWWADHSWGRWWAFDPKETWALITWIVYLIVIHTRFGGVRNKALLTAWLSVLGFFVMLWTYFGVNLILPGLHAYA